MSSIDNSLLKQYAKNQLTSTRSDASVGAINSKKSNIDYSKYGEGFSKEFIDAMNNDIAFQKALKRTQLNEAGYNNDKDDRGGETNMGITKKYYPNEDIKNLTRERADAILYRDYWIKHKINTLPIEISDIVFDNAVVQGQGTAIMNLQKALNVKADGLIGPQTLNALNNINYLELKKLFTDNANAIEDAYQNNDPSQKKFEKGHRNRYNRYLK
jgi:lysozyme family protein